MATDATCVVFFANGDICTDLNSREIIWDCVTSLETYTRKICMANHSERCLVAKIETAALVFKVSETSYNPNGLIFVMLLPQQLRTIHVSFTPSQKGTFTTNLTFSWYEFGSLQVSYTDVVVLRGTANHNLVDISSSNFSTPVGTNQLQLTFYYWRDRVSTFSSVVRCRHGSDLRVPAFLLGTFEPCTFVPAPVHLQIAPNKLVLEPDDDINLCVRYQPSEIASCFLRGQHLVGKRLQLGVLRFYFGRETVRRCLRKMERELGWPDNVAPWKRELISEFTGEFYVFVNDAELTDERMREAWSKIYKCEISVVIEYI